MINKDITHENRYRFTDTSTNDEFQKLLKRYPKINCIICNSNTSKVFKTGLLGSRPITVNNKLEDGVFLINNFR